MVVQRPVMETNRVRNPADGLAQVGLPAPRPHLSESALEGKKTGAALLISGVLLALLGVTFTAMGWQHHKANPGFELIQLLGPVLISVGGTFVLTSMCKFSIMSCCKNSDEETAAPPPVTERTSTGQPLTFTNTSHPVVLRGTTTVLCLPPAYSFITREVHRTIGGCVNGVHAGSPPYDTVFCVGNAAFTAGEEEDEGSARSADTERRRRRCQKMDDERGRGDEESGSTSLSPPAYEDIFPSSNEHTQT
ncbi:transmembrane protein 174 [Tautogolabrus adspersus]